MKTQVSRSTAPLCFLMSFLYFTTRDKLIINKKIPRTTGKIPPLGTDAKTEKIETIKTKIKILGRYNLFI